MADAPAEARRRRPVRRGEGEVTEWPRGLTGYVPSGPADATPSEEEDRLTNRLALAARLIGLLRSQGHPVDRELEQLRAAERARTAGRRTEAARAVDQVLEALEGRPRAGPGRDDTR